MSVRPRRPLRLLHTSDIHLECDSFGLSENGREMTLAMRRNFTEVITIANREQVDLTLIAGDLFDSSRVTEEALEFAMDEIARAAMPV